ncbi:uncharacterized protein OCT59_025767 [Rhizophagus irregularis]|uniref:Uncharacterized protein n=2 Tax=Rhizophagus irregularis TaxID=588596 RepID=A0A015JUL4_RHIIW|nr:hypothetical protein GLOIN_2v1786619 [Rhizophagus irregularis DAOM 181602=DAOM 197198]EXX71010.1 hypothetical protein RirG_082370 [Rhizophagus irregularis DAOM 197198w]POG61452.1 hypothetical protein GLOIN_2v1786619 [Rhizophagus irregularis DAOM 181602=DAOM 197198]UZO05417.1 hypothetical protein OCT59_025767 [Rhizophagus irregularis]GBC11056.1 hypothetical protein GLOIN_2v1786619 [Rhizophagus irregularis DAOM 181602=DAOM 197198]|eukprot:XP_025168318.1 hypothetical protein GLOIN_2v1786619 [Rhizophagus irregularis DAOM 181602=DAOM 197198]
MNSKKTALRQNLLNLSNEFYNIKIPDYTTIFHEKIHNENLEHLIHVEYNKEQKNYCPYLSFDNNSLKEAAYLLSEYFYCLEKTLDKLIYSIIKPKYKQESENLLNFLLWKKNVVTIRYYMVHNLFYELNNMQWDFNINMIEKLYDSKFKETHFQFN